MTMKCVIEFGIPGAAHVDNLICTSLAQGAKFASALCHVAGAVGTTAHPEGWKVTRGQPRITWTRNDHAYFVALSMLDGKPRGPASSVLWKV